MTLIADLTALLASEDEASTENKADKKKGSGVEVRKAKAWVGMYESGGGTRKDVGRREGPMILDGLKG